jgi:two-component system, NtrC family, response regulator HydG
MRDTLLIIDDDLYIVNLLDNFFKREGYYTHTLHKGRPALQLLEKKRFDVVLCDIRLPDIEGIDLLHHIRQTAPDTVVIMMTAYAEIRTAVESIKSGAFDYVVKPIHPDNIRDVVKNAIKSKRKAKSGDKYEFISGNCRKMLEVIKQSKLVAPTNMAVLIQGETGSGKEYIARLIHDHSERKTKKFVAIDCGAIPKELAASELFGHVKGAFTGAISNKTGYFEQAKGGTIFMDEIGNLSYETQVKLLRAIQQKVITRVGDTNPIAIDVRIISATNSNLTDQAHNGTFREDLYHRINEFKLEVPPLRARGDDIMLFANHFLKQANRELKKEVQNFTHPVIKVFNEYSWYGNLREMRNVIKRSVLIAKDDLITIKCLPEELKYNKKNALNLVAVAASERSLKDAAKEAERAMIENALREANQNKSLASRILKIDRKTLYNKMKELRMD